MCECDGEDRTWTDDAVGFEPCLECGVQPVRYILDDSSVLDYGEKEEAA